MGIIVKNVSFSLKKYKKWQFLVEAVTANQIDKMQKMPSEYPDHQYKEDFMNNNKRYIRFSYNERTLLGCLDASDQIEVLEGDLFGDHKATGEKLKLQDVKLLAPVEPKTILCVGRNYKSHGGDVAASLPGIFTKLPTTISGPEADIPYALGATDLHYEGEMVVVIGKTCSRVSSEDAKNYVFGVTCGNDMSERNWQKSDLQWVRAKASDGFGPIGPWIVTGLDYDNLLLETRVNGETVQSERTNMLIHNVGAVVSFISQTITLNPGDIIYTGTPGTTKAVNPGDVIEVELEGVGVLINKVVAIR